VTRVANGISECYRRPSIPAVDMSQDKTATENPQRYREIDNWANTE